jgi:hypothetical protein
MLGVAEQAAVSPSPLFPMTSAGVDDRFLTGMCGFPKMSGVALTKSQIFPRYFNRLRSEWRAELLVLSSSAEPVRRF